MKMNIYNLNEKGLRNFINLQKIGLTSFQLKMIAVVTMIIDHTAIVFLENGSTEYNVFRAIGRMSFPIFCFLISEGFTYTSDRFKYIRRIGIFAIISEIPYDMLGGSWVSMKHQNVMFTLFIGLVMLWVLDAVSNCRINYPQSVLKHIGILRLNSIVELLVIGAAFTTVHFLNSDYQEAGILLILCFYVFRKYRLGRMICNLVFNMGMFGFNIQWWGALSVLPIALYNGECGYKKLKYAFYIFYPAHLVVLVVLKFLTIKIFL